MKRLTVVRGKRIDPTEPNRFILYIDDGADGEGVFTSSSREQLEELADEKYPNRDWCVVGLNVVSRKKL